MISIAEAISDLLFVRDTVVVPGLGAFVKKSVSAKVNPVANYFTKPSCQIEFDANLREDNDLVVNYISEKNDIPEDEARRLLMMFVSDSFNSLKAGNKVVLNDLGSLLYDWAGDLVFQQNKSANHNTDAFGLCDFSPVSVAAAKSNADIEWLQQDKNTPMTIDEKAVHEEDENPEPRRVWLWILLCIVLLAGIGLALQHFKVVDFGLNDPRTEKPEKVEPWTISFPSEVKTWNTAQPAPAYVDTVPAPDSTPTPPSENPAELEPVKTIQELEPAEVLKEPVKPEATIRIIAGCFSQEENATRLANSLKDKGYTAAFVEKRGSKWYVSFGRYATDEEASQALRDIRAGGDDKSWILK